MAVRCDRGGVDPDHRRPEQDTGAARADRDHARDDDGNPQQSGFDHAQEHSFTLETEIVALAHPRGQRGAEIIGSLSRNADLVFTRLRNEAYF
jgi:hypothetical protein